MSAPSNSIYVNGQGQLSGDQLNTFLQTATNVAALRNFPGTSGMVLELQGFSTINDGGQGLFYWNSSGTGPDDGGVTNVVPNGTVLGCWTRFGTNITTTVNSLSSPNSTLTLSGSSGNVTIDLNLSKGNSWLIGQTFNYGARGVAGVAGSARNLIVGFLSNTTASVSADEVVVETAIGGFAFKAPAFNVTLNISSTGVNGMDTGAPPTSGALYLYAIYNPTTATISVLATTASTGTVYNGANIPSGYTMSALIGIYLTNGSAQFNVFTQLDREIFLQAPVSVLSSVAGQNTLTSVSLTTAVPPNTKTCSGFLSYGGTGVNALEVSADGTGTGAQFGSVTGGTVASFTGVLNFRLLPILTSQTIFWKTGATSAASTSMTIGSYTF